MYILYAYIILESVVHILKIDGGGKKSDFSTQQNSHLLLYTIYSGCIYGITKNSSQKVAKYTIY